MNEGDIILTPIPQADGKLKNRPAIILREMPHYHDLLVCGVSTQLHQYIKEFEKNCQTGHDVLFYITDLPAFPAYFDYAAFVLQVNFTLLKEFFLMIHRMRLQQAGHY